MINFALCFTIGIGGDSPNAGPDIQNVVGLGLGETLQQPRSIPTQVPRPGLPNSCPIFLPFLSFISGFSLFLTSLHVEQGCVDQECYTHGFLS